MSQSTVHMFVEPYRNEVCVSPCFLTWSTSANARLGPRKLHNVYCQRVHYALELLYLQQTKSLLRSWASFCSQIFSATVHNLLYLFILIQFFFNQPKKKKKNHFEDGEMFLSHNLCHQRIHEFIIVRANDNDH